MGTPGSKFSSESEKRRSSSEYDLMRRLYKLRDVSMKFLASISLWAVL